MIHYLALIVALIISGVSGAFSIAGLMAMFSSQFWPILVMGTSLEVGKLVSVSWLYRNWEKTGVLLKTYLSLAIVVLMLITSMGVYGWLAKSHIEQTLNISTGVADQAKIASERIEIEADAIKDLDRQIAQIDVALDKITSQGNPQTALRAAEQQKKNRETLTKRREERTEIMSKLRTDKVRYETEIRKNEAEIGPLKYVADLVYGESDPSQLEKSVRWVILIIVSVFDPLAIVLLIAANQGLVRVSEQRKLADSVIEIDSGNVLKVK